jgi:hypothetical protein
MQKRAPGGAATPQLGQLCSSAVPHDMQNFAAAGFSVPQFVHACDAMHSRYGMPKPFHPRFGANRRVCDEERFFG